MQGHPDPGWIQHCSQHSCHERTGDQLSGRGFQFCFLLWLWGWGSSCPLMKPVFPSLKWGSLQQVSEDSCWSNSEGSDQFSSQREELTWLSQHLDAAEGGCEQQTQDHCRDLHVEGRGLQRQPDNCWFLSLSQPLCSSGCSVCLLKTAQALWEHPEKLLPGQGHEWIIMKAGPKSLLQIPGSWQDRRGKLWGGDLTLFFFFSFKQCLWSDWAQMVISRVIFTKLYFLWNEPYAVEKESRRPRAWRGKEIQVPSLVPMFMWWSLGFWRLERGPKTSFRLPFECRRSQLLWTFPGLWEPINSSTWESHPHNSI